jgi:hypothetical protein
MPIREYPKIDPPIIQVITTYRGASAPVVDNQITEILEGAVAGIEGIKAIQSQSRDERSQITLEFRLTRDVDSAANDVRDRVARALARLPEQADTPIVQKVDGDSRPILWIALNSETLSPLDLTDIAHLAGSASARRAWSDRSGCGRRDPARECGIARRAAGKLGPRIDRAHRHADELTRAIPPGGGGAR